jgi:hypothetical protein
LAGTGLAAPVSQILGVRPAWGLSGRAERVIFFYFPDGVAGASQGGSPSAWHASGDEFSFQVSDHLGRIQDHRDSCLFFRGLSSGPTDNGSHPGAAKKLLTAADNGNHVSIDQFLAQTAGASSPWRHLYLGAMANQNNASGDKHISYPSGGSSLAPQDNPRQAFQDLFGGLSPQPGPSDQGDAGSTGDPRKASILDAAIGDLQDLKAKLGTLESTRLDMHLESMREIELRVAGTTTVTPTVQDATCDTPWVDTGGFTDNELYDASKFPAILKAQIDNMVLAMSCGLTRVGTIQCSHHTSDLEMSRFQNTELFETDPFMGMRSHQASHYGASHDMNNREYNAYVRQRRWFGDQFAYLLDQLAARPEGDGTMLDHTVAVFLSEVSDGNTHSHDDLPIVLAGRAGGRIRTGRLLQYGYERHGKLWVSVAHAMGEYIDSFGDASWGALPGVVD